MSPNFQNSLSKLERLSPSKLDKTSRRIRGVMADAEWKMGLCLLALKRSGAFRKLGFGTLSAYAERVLQLSGRKVGALLGAAEALEHLPLISEAFRAGRVCWSKVRVMHGLATPETEAEWLEFARVHTSVEVERKVALSPLEWKRHRALKASLAGKPSVSSAEVTALLLSTPAVVCGVSGDGASGRFDSKGSSVACGELTAASEEATRAGEQELDGAFGQLKDATREERQETALEAPSRTEATEIGAKAASSAPNLADTLPAPPSPPRTIRLVFELTPDQYALYEQADSRVRAQEGRRLPRAEVLKRMAESVLSEGSAKARARHQVLVHTVEGSGNAWYETERGVLPVASEILEEALGGHEVLMMDVDGRVEAASETSVSDSSCALSTAKSTAGTGSESETFGKSRAQPGNLSQAQPENMSNGLVDGHLVAPHRPVDSSDLIKAPVDHLCDSPDQGGTRSPQTHTSDHHPKRTAIPNATIRQVFARAGHRCECCGRKGGRLDVHHRDPVSEGGSNDVGRLELLCRGCHTENHEPDYEEKHHWRAARDAALERRLGSGGFQDFMGPGDRKTSPG